MSFEGYFTARPKSNYRGDDLPSKRKLKIRKKIVRLAIFCIGLWLAIELYMPSRTVYYRLDITFEIDGIPVTGSGVQKYKISRNRTPLSTSQLNSGAYGDAVIVDLPGKKSVFALMATPREDGSYKGGNGVYDFLIIRSCKLREQNRRISFSSIVRLVGRMSGTCEIPLHYIPVLVIFENEKDPTSVKRIFPNHLENTLGENAKFIGASLTITDEPMTTGIEKRLPWLSDDTGSRLTPRYTYSSKPSLSDYLRKKYFRRY
nr:hypothetical protein [uncultured Cohaesibacter sp.]